jgi:hypothetical protein
LNVKIYGINAAGVKSQLHNNDITLSKRETEFNVNNLANGYQNYSVTLTGQEMADVNGVTQIKTLKKVADDKEPFVFEFQKSQFKTPVTNDGPTRLYLQFSCIPTTGNGLFMNSQHLPNSFYLIFSGTGFTGERAIQIQGGSFVIPFNPMLQSNGAWKAKVVMGSMEYPEGAGRVNVSTSDFQLVDGKVIFRYSPETAQQCDDFKKALGL